MALLSSRSFMILPQRRLHSSNVQAISSPARCRVSWKPTKHTAPMGALGFMAELADRAAALNAEGLARKEGKDLIGKKFPVEPLRAFPATVLAAKADIVNTILERTGVVCLQNVISDETADILLAYINEESDRAKQEVTDGLVEFDDRFGGVNCRGINGLFGNRQDMFMSVENPVVRQGLEEAVKNLGPLLEAAVTRNGMLHELSSIVSDPGSPRQCIHADTIYLPSPQFPVSMAPLYTFFIALQDITDDMGHTTFLPRTHTEQAHKLWNTGPGQKQAFLSSSAAVMSSLKKGDVSIFDSRLLHCGGANVSDSRRVLFYFTVSSQQNWPLPDGLHGSNSMRVGERWKYQLKDVGL